MEEEDLDGSDWREEKVLPSVARTSRVQECGVPSVMDLKEVDVASRKRKDGRFHVLQES